MILKVAWMEGTKFGTARSAVYSQEPRSQTRLEPSSY